MVSTFSATTAFLLFFTFLAALALTHTSMPRMMITKRVAFMIADDYYFSISSSSMVKVSALKGLMLPMS